MFEGNYSAIRLRRGTKPVARASTYGPHPASPKSKPDLPLQDATLGEEKVLIGNNPPVARVQGSLAEILEGLNREQTEQDFSVIREG